MFQSEEEVMKFNWNIGLEGKAWREEARPRYYLAPEKIELIEGKIFCEDEQRLAMIALLLENVGVERVVRLGNPEVWRKAIEALPKS